MDAERFPIRVGRRSRWMIRLFGATPETAYADVGDELLIRFGPARIRTPVANIARYRIEGPFTWVKSIGIRRSFRGGDVSFCASDHGAVRMDFIEPVPWGPLHVPAVWAGADDLDGLAAALTERGIPGVDVRK